MVHLHKVYDSSCVVSHSVTGGRVASVTDDPLASMRRHYDRPPLLESDLAPTPIDQFAWWLEDAVGADVAEPNAMVLSTVHDGEPRSRHVLLKHADADGFVFYTNLTSDKARDVAAEPRVSLCFPWLAMQRQVIVNGTALRVPREEAWVYWRSRPRDSQIGAWASHQSAVIGSRAELEHAADEMALRFPGDVPLPDFWGGYRVRPATVEFWQGGPGRLHDRLRYRRADGGWVIERLAP